MKKNNLKPVAAALGSSVILALAVSANAADNPFQMVEFGEGVTVAGEAMDMQGNEVSFGESDGGGPCGVWVEKDGRTSVLVER